MMGVLVRKELRSVIPYILLLIVLIFVSFVVEAFSGIPHLANVKDLFNDYITFSYENAIFTFLIYFALMAGLFNREYDDNTLDFLDALPTTRLHIFAGKIMAAWVIMALTHLLDMGAGLLWLALQDNSLLDVWDWSFIGTTFLLRMVTGFVMVGWAAFFSLWRSFGWLVFATILMIYLILSEIIPALKVLDFVGLAAHDLATFDWSIRWLKLAGHVVFAGFLYLLAFLLFLGVTDQLNRLLSVMRENLLGTVGLMTLTAAMVLMLTAVGLVVVSRTVGEEPDEEEPVRFASWATAKASTEFYDAVYLTDRADSARQLLDGADNIHEGVRKFFGADPGRKIFLDMSGANRHAGVAFWNRVIIDLTESPEPEFLQAVLAHETAHVFLDRLSDNRLSSKLESTRFFHEGVASYVEWRVSGRQASRQTYEQWAALIHARNPVRFEQLVNDRDLSARYDTNVVYPLGQVFAASIADEYGEEAIPKLARAFVRPNAPQSLTGLALWQDTFQACRLNLEKVIGRYQTKLGELTERDDSLIVSLPRLQATLEDDEWGATLRVTATAPAGWTIICRTRRTEASADRTYQILVPDEAGVVHLSRAAFDSGAGWYQLGLTSASFTVYEPWRAFSFSTATPP